MRLREQNKTPLLIMFFLYVGISWSWPLLAVLGMVAFVFGYWRG
jgi:hypothetical protein